MINKDAASGGYGEGFDLVNLHSDTTDITNEISIQGPFTHTHIGGRQARHVHYMEGFDPSVGKIPNISVRPEAWNIYIAEFNATETQTGPGVGDGAIGFTTPDYSVGPIDTDQQKATFYREERAKRPVNIKNIQTIIGTGSHGNFTYNYEVMSTFGDQGYYLRRVDDLLPEAISQALPETTNYQTLIALTASDAGSYFGADNNRQVESETIETPVTNAKFRITFDSSVPPETYMQPFELRIERANYILNSSNDDTRAFFLDFDPTNTNGTITRTADEIQIQIRVIVGDWAATLANFNAVLAAAPITTYFTIVNSSVYSYDFSEVQLLGDDGNGGTITQSNPNALTYADGTFRNGVSTYQSSVGNIIATQDRSTGSANVIRTRFSAPGGP